MASSKSYTRATVASEERGLAKLASTTGLTRSVKAVRNVLGRRRESLESELGEITDAQEAVDAVVDEFIVLLDGFYEATEVYAKINNDLRKFIRQRKKELIEEVG